MWIIGKKSDESVVEINGRTAPVWTQEALEEVIPVNYGGVAGDYSYYECPTLTEERMRDGWEYSVTWTTNEITGIDFSAEESKRWVKFSADKTEINDDGVETVEITLEVWKADLSGIDTNVTTSSEIPVLTPNGERWTKASVVNGSKVKNFKTTKSGVWVFPSQAKRFKNIRVFNQITLEVIETDILG